MDQQTLLSRIQGCLLGGAVGDALGYAVEFTLWPAIQKRYGADGIMDFELTRGIAIVSDDTQMTLFTANGMLNALTDGSSISHGIWLAYKDWLATQECESSIVSKRSMNTWLVNLPRLFARRAPGLTCLSAIGSSENGGTFHHNLNHSKGCGSIMRVAPLGLYPWQPTNGMAPSEFAAMEAAKAGALTHGHALSHISSAALGYTVYRLTFEDLDRSSPDTLRNLFMDTLSAMRKLFADYPLFEQDIDTFCGLTQKAITMAESSFNDHEALIQLGEGWIAEEAWAIAVFACLRYPNDFHRAMVCAVNHDGDSDSTGAVTGNLLGAWLGREAVEAAFDLDKLEFRDTILELGCDLCHGVPDRSDPEWIRWQAKYTDHTYKR